MKERNLLKNNGVQSLLASLACIVLGLFLGYVVLLLINPAGAGEAILTVIKNFLTYNKPASQMKYLGNTLVKTAPLLMCSLSILFAYKVAFSTSVRPASTASAWPCACMRPWASSGAGCPACCWPCLAAPCWAVSPAC